MRTLYKLLIIAYLLICSTVYAETALRFGIFPANELKTMIRLFSPIAQKLEKELGIPIQLVSAASKDDFNKKTIEGRFDLIWTCGACYIAVTEKTEMYAIARGTPPFKGIVMVRKDSGIDNISDLRGKKVAAIGAHSLAGYLFLRNGLAEIGIFAPKDITIDFHPLSESIPFKVHSGSYDAGVFSEDTLIRSRILESIRDDLKIIFESPLIPQRPFAVKADMDEDIVDKIRNALTSISLDDPEFSHILTGLNLEGIEAVDDSSYDEFRELYRITKYYSKLEQESE